MPTAERVCLLSPISVYTRQSSCNVNSTHWNETGRSRTASPTVIAQEHSLLSSSQSSFISAGKNSTRVSKIFLLFVEFFIAYFETTSVLECVPTELSRLHIQRRTLHSSSVLSRIYSTSTSRVHSEQPGGGCSVRDSYKNTTLYSFPIIFNRNRVLSISHSTSCATTMIHTAIGSAAT